MLRILKDIYIYTVVASTLGRISFEGGFFLAASLRKLTHFLCESVSNIPMLLMSSY